MTRTDARTLIEENARRTLVVRFVKRATGELRRMVCIYYPEAAEKARFRFNPLKKGSSPSGIVRRARAASSTSTVCSPSS